MTETPSAYSVIGINSAKERPSIYTFGSDASLAGFLPTGGENDSLYL